MTNEALVETMRNLKTQWAILKDEKKPKIDRRSACKMILELSNKAASLDPKFEIIDMNNTIYAEFLPASYMAKSNVNWGDVDDTFMLRTGKECMGLVSDLEAIAVKMTKSRLPKEPEDSQKFGMIVSAYTDKLLKAYIYFNS